LATKPPSWLTYTLHTPSYKQGQTYTQDTRVLNAREASGCTAMHVSRATCLTKKCCKGTPYMWGNKGTEGERSGDKGTEGERRGNKGTEGDRRGQKQSMNSLNTHLQ